MAQKAQDLINVEKLLKEDVLPFYNNELNVSATPFLEKVKKTKLRSNESRFGARIGIGGGFGMSAERTATPQANAPIYENFVATAKDAYVDIRMSEKDVRLGRESGALMDTVMDNVEASFDAAKWNVGRMVFGDGTGKLANITAAASATPTVTVDDTSKLIVGLTVDVYKYSAASATDGTLDATHSALQIVAINHATKQVTLSGNVTLSTAQTTSSAYGFLTVQNSYKREITGLGAIFDSAVTTLYGLTKASTPIIVPRSYNANHDIDDIALTNAVRHANRNNGVKIDMMLCGDEAYEAYEKYMRSATHTVVEKRTFHGGAVGYDVVMGNQITTIVNERFVPSTKIWGVDTSTFELRESGWDYADYQGSVFVLQPGTSEYRALLANYLELICYNPGGCVELYDCDVSA